MRDTHHTQAVTPVWQKVNETGLPLSEARKPNKYSIFAIDGRYT
jgi:hypothetical protein